MQILLKILLASIFFIVVTPLAVIMRLFGIDLVDRNIDKDRASYWQQVSDKHPSATKDKPE